MYASSSITCESQNCTPFYFIFLSASSSKIPISSSTKTWVVPDVSTAGACRKKSEKVSGSVVKGHSVAYCYVPRLLPEFHPMHWTSTAWYEIKGLTKAVSCLHCVLHYGIVKWYTPSHHTSLYLSLSLSLSHTHTHYRRAVLQQSSVARSKNPILQGWIFLSQLHFVHCGVQIKYTTHSFLFT